MNAKISNKTITQGLLLASLSFCVQAISADEVATVKKSDVEVRMISLNLPKDAQQMRKTLREYFVDQAQEQQVGSLASADWKALFAEYRQVLVNKARSGSLDYRSLEKCLAAVLEDSQDKDLDPPPEIAYLPVGAYFAKQGRQPVWIIVVKWEYAKTVDPDTGKEIPLGFGHVCAYAFRARSTRQIGFATCD